MNASFLRLAQSVAIALTVVAAPAGPVEPLSIALVPIPSGAFAMGSASTELGRGTDETLHRVTLTRPFLMARYEVSQAEWRRVMGTSPSQYAPCEQCPVERVNFFETQQFLAALNESQAAYRYRLPSEAEWEYACRAGSTSPFATGENLTTDEANYNGQFPYATFAKGIFRGHPVPVGSFAPNAWGLSDMHGNVWEWTSDWYGPYSQEALRDPSGPASGEKRSIRGGSWYFDANSSRCALRYTHAPIDRGFSLGFRVAAERR
jgi:formylglycine-generating enzyme required for sulfatase activity